MVDIDQLIMALDTIKPLSYSITNMFEIGVVMKEFYMLHTSESYHKTMLYAFGMTGYLQCIYALTKNSSIHYCKLSNKQTSMKNAYYPSLKNNSNVIKNNIDLKKNYCILWINIIPIRQKLGIILENEAPLI